MTESINEARKLLSAIRREKSLIIRWNAYYYCYWTSDDSYKIVGPNQKVVEGIKQDEILPAIQIMSLTITNEQRAKWGKSPISLEEHNGNFSIRNAQIQSANKALKEALVVSKKEIEEMLNHP